MVTRMKGEAQHNLLWRKKLPDRSWPHHPVSNSLGPWEARMRQRDLIPVPWALGGLRGQSTFNLERGVVVLKEQASLNVAFPSIISVLLKVFL